MVEVHTVIEAFVYFNPCFLMDFSNNRQQQTTILVFDVQLLAMSMAHLLQLCRSFGAPLVVKLLAD